MLRSILVEGAVPMATYLTAALGKVASGKKANGRQAWAFPRIHF